MRSNNSGSLITFSNGRIPSGIVRFQNVEEEKWDKIYRVRPDAVATLENGKNY